jgi:hypothetical protein
MLSRLLYIAKQQRENEIELQATSCKNNADMRKTQFNTKGIYTFFIITFSILIVWIPHLSVMFYEDVTGTEVAAYAIFITQLILYSFACVNVLIYYFRNKEFKKTARRLLKQL